MGRRQSKEEEAEEKANEECRMKYDGDEGPSSVTNGIATSEKEIFDPPRVTAFCKVASD